jgi:hypothetical protein
MSRILKLSAVAVLALGLFASNGSAADPFRTNIVGLNQHLSPGAINSLNPQPLPPGFSSRFSISSKVSAGVASSLNPQPLPPGRISNSQLQLKSNFGAFRR